jgi:hypothetical protein
MEAQHSFNMTTVDIADLLKVTIASIGAWFFSVFDSTKIIYMNEIFQSTVESAAVLVLLAYTLVKLYKAVRQSVWDKEDRNNNKGNAQ